MDDIFGALGVAAIIGSVGWLWRTYQNGKDLKLIYDFLKSSTNNTEYVYRSTEAISSETNLTENRVESLCAKTPKIKRNTKQRQSWKLNE